MKVAVYTIALNEEQFVKRWYESAKDADYLVIADTGSTDGTVELAKSLGINVFSISIDPWRFDDARNASLALIPNDIDYCICLDMDEVLNPGWKDALEVAFKEGWTRPRHTLTTSWNPDGSPGFQFSAMRITARKGYRWKYPIHEIQSAYGIEETQGWINLEIEHHPDNNKSRGSYLPMLAMAVQEYPNDSRCSFYYGRELYFHKLYADASTELMRYLELPESVWKPQRANAYWYLAETNPDNAELHLLCGYNEDPTRRECAVKLAQYYHDTQDWEACKRWALTALAIKEKPLDYFCEAWAWNGNPHDILSLAAYHSGDYTLAIEHGEIALSLDPENERLKTNMGFYLSKA